MNAKTLSVLQGPIEIAGQVGLTCIGLREIGVACDLLLLQKHPFGYELVTARTLKHRDGVLRKLELLSHLVRIAARYNTLHLHYGLSFTGSMRDIAVLKKLGKSIHIEFWGSDVRFPSLEAQRNPFYINAHSEGDPSAMLRRWADFTEGHAIIPDDSFRLALEPFFHSLHVVRQRVDTQAILPKFPEREAKSVPRLFHAPSNQPAKGSAIIQEAVASLNKRGVKFEYIEVTKKTNECVMQELGRADLVVDQIRLGSHGVFAVEAMAMGKPVICYTMPELVPTYPDGFPIINANPHTIEDVLEQWLTCPSEMRYAQGQLSRSYAERVHDCRVVAKRLQQVYLGQPVPN